ncbi:MAG: ectonucleotide pyrophosphatase/phosphodiesterase [Acidobacteriota bacterium]|nr:ectonucleotide pyrophosphatase/phosphodiesterase [Acidobacteriota bacterium]
MRARAATVVVAAVLFTCGPVAEIQPVAGEPPLVLISIDGFRWDYLDLFDAPHLRELAATGARAERLVPVFPTKTFPNHYSAVTGLYPRHHGIVANIMSDPGLGRFSLRDRDAVEDGRWWQGEPIWVTAERQGVRAATCFWPGSEAEIHGVRPTHWMRYDRDFPTEARVEKVFEWLDLPAQRRPGFMTLYFSDVDSAAHRTGPTSDETRTAVARVDRAIGTLLDGLRDRAVLDEMHLLVVSDHGMTDTPAGQAVYLEDYIDLTGIEVSGDTPTVFLSPPPEREAAVLQALNEAHPQLRGVRSAETPATWQFRDHPRIPAIIAMTPEGWHVRAQRRPSGDEPLGMHGYDPALQSMHGSLIAHGPQIASGKKVGPVRMIDLYELMCHLLSLKPAPNDGDLSGVRGLLRSR